MKLNFKNLLEDPVYVFHGTGKGQALNIQKDGYIRPNNVGEDKPSISFTKKKKYAEYYANAKAGKSKSVLLRTVLNDKFFLSDRIRDNDGYEYITFEKIPSSELEIETVFGWQPLNNWDIISNEPL